MNIIISFDEILNILNNQTNLFLSIKNIFSINNKSLGIIGQSELRFSKMEFHLQSIADTICIAYDYDEELIPASFPVCILTSTLFNLIESLAVKYPHIIKIDSKENKIYVFQNKLKKLNYLFESMSILDITIMDEQVSIILSNRKND